MNRGSFPLATLGARRYQTTISSQVLSASSSSSSSVNNATTRFYILVARWKKNFSRLYARRLLEIAAASASVQLLKAELASAVTKKPSQWKDWQAKDWEETAIASLGDSRISRFWMAAQRLMGLAVLASPLIILGPLSAISPSMQQYAWQYGIWGVEQAGPTWIKLVQWATTRQDLFSPEFCQYFSKLRDDTEGHSWKETQRIVEQELGLARNSLQLHPEPIGSGCVAQVYRGRLMKSCGQYPENTKVAVKVQHPGIWDKVCIDFYILHKMAKFLESIPYANLQYLSLSDTVRQFRDIMLPQLDLRLEAQHLRRFNQDFASDDQVSFPRPLDQFTTKQILVETFMEGTPIMEYVSEEVSTDTRRQLALLGLQTTLKMIFLNDFVHGDLHPGNILVSGEYPNLKLHLLDCGLVLEMGPDQHVNLVKVLGAFTRRDGRLAGQLMVDMGAEEQASSHNIELFVAGIEQICIMDSEQNFIEKIGDYITDICSLACMHRVKLEPAFINAALAVEIMEGTASALYPDMTVQSVALPIIVRAEMMHALGFH